MLAAGPGGVRVDNEVMPSGHALSCARFRCSRLYGTVFDATRRCTCGGHGGARDQRPRGNDDTCHRVVLRPVVVVGREDRVVAALGVA